MTNIKPDPYQPLKKRFQPISLFVTIVLTLGIVLITIYGKTAQDKRSKAAFTGTTLSIMPEIKTVKAGDVFTVGIAMNTNTDVVSGAELHLTYDKIAVEIKEFSVGTALPIILSPTVIKNGEVSVTIGAQPASPFKGSAIIGTLSLIALTNKTSSINFLPSTSVAAIEKTASTLVSTSGSRIQNVTTVDLTITSTMKPTSVSLPTGIIIPTPISQPIASSTPINTQKPVSFGDLIPTKISTSIPIGTISTPTTPSPNSQISLPQQTPMILRNDSVSKTKKIIENIRNIFKNIIRSVFRPITTKKQQ